jgi:hypothetical protein
MKMKTILKSSRISLIATIALAVGIGLTSSASAADDVTFSYQGRLLRNAAAHDGTAQFLFAVVVEEGAVEEVVWTSDPDAELTPTVTGSPVELTVTRGSFSVQIGDEDLAGMASLESSIWNQDGKYSLRVWVRPDSVSPYELLSPDQRISNPRSYGRESRRIQTIYVNSDTGNDRYPGVRANRPKKTLEGALAVVPPFLRNRVTIQLAPGTYRESVRISNFFALNEEAGLTILGNTADPATVILSGESTSTPGTYDKAFGVNVVDVGGNIDFNGITFGTYTNNSAQVDTGGKARFEDCVFNSTQPGSVGLLVRGRANVVNCTVSGRNGVQATFGGVAEVSQSTVTDITQFYGLLAVTGGILNVTNTTISDCAFNAVYALGGSIRLSNCTIENPSSTGWAMRVMQGGTAVIWGCTFENNNFGALRATNGGSVLFRNPATVFQNGGTAIRVESGASVSIPSDNATVTYSNNTTNVSVGTDGVYTTQSE